MTRTLAVGLLVTAIAIAALATWLRLHGAGDKATLEFATAELGNVVRTVSAVGTVKSARDVAIKAKASGEIISLPFDLGDSVRQGELVAELDPVDEKRSLSRAEIATSATLARLEQARLNVTISEATLRTNRERADASLTAARILEADRLQRATRLTTLHSGELVSREELDAAIAEAASATAARVGAEIRIAELLTDELAIGNQREQVRLAEADFESSQVALLDANQRMLETRIFAPIDGVVSALDVQEGQIISSAISNVGGGTTLLTISDLQRILVYASVDENDVGEVQIGQRVEIAAEGFEKETFHGSVERIAVKGSDLNNVISFETRIHVSGNNARKLKPEMSVSASIVLEEATGVVMIPSECLIPIGDGWEVDVRLPNGRIQSRPVMVGITDGVSTEIRSGLAKGDAVVLKGMIDSQWQAPKKRQRAFPPGPGPAGAL